MVFIFILSTFQPLTNQNFRAFLKKGHFNMQHMEIIATVIGGFLAAGTGWFLQWRLEKSRLNRLKKLFLVGIKDDLNNSLELYNRLIEDWEKTQIIWFTTLNEFNESREVYVRNKDWITLLPDESTRKKILQYYRRSANHLVQLQNAQQRKYDITQKFNQLTAQLYATRKATVIKVNLPLQDAKNEALLLMEDEATEMKNLGDKHLPELVHKLERFRTEAKDILDIPIIKNT